MTDPSDTSDFGTRDEATLTVLRRLRIDTRFLREGGALRWVWSPAGYPTIPEGLVAKLLAAGHLQSETFGDGSTEFALTEAGEAWLRDGLARLDAARQARRGPLGAHRSAPED